MSEALLKRIDSKLSHLMTKPEKKKETWVKSPLITSLTGWDKEGMRRARVNGYIQWRKDENGFWYLLESLNHIFFKK